MTYADRTLTCVDCGVEFIHSAADQEFYTQKGFVSDPKRCSELPGEPARRPRFERLRPARHRRPARLRARRATDPRVLRRPVLVVRQPGPGAVQAAHGPAGLLLGLLPDPLGQLTAASPAPGRAFRPRSGACRRPRLRTIVAGRRTTSRSGRIPPPWRCSQARSMRGGRPTELVRAPKARFLEVARPVATFVPTS